MKDILYKLQRNEDLSEQEISEVVSSFAKRLATPAQVGAFIYAISKKDVCVDEIYYFAKSMRANAIACKIDEPTLVDSCGTGADGASTFNISTTSAIVAAAAGAKVIKQTNSHITSRCGSSDFLEALNIPLCRTVEEVKNAFQANNIAFVHSPYFNKVANYINPIRQEIGIRSVFNFLGPLINPSFPSNQLLGVASFEMAEKLIQVLKLLGLNQAMVINAKNPNMDEISVCGETNVFELKNGEITNYVIKPEDFGIKRTELLHLKGATPIYNADLVREILRGKIQDSKLDVIAMNAGAMIYLSGLSSNLLQGIIKAYSAINSGKAMQKLIDCQNTAKTLSA